MQAELAAVWSQRTPANVRVQFHVDSPYHSIKFDLFSTVRVDQLSPFKRRIVENYK